MMCFHGWLETLIPYFTTKIFQVTYQRERLELGDGDFLDLDWLKKGQSKLLVISHGFEGNSHDHFIEKSAAHFIEKGYDILVWHYRSCSKEMNRLPRFYDHGDIDDLDQVIAHALENGYKELILLGFSFGGSLVINYLGNKRPNPRIKRAVVFSAPLDLFESTSKMKKGINRLVSRSFRKKWRRKIRRKAEQFPDLFDLSDIEKINTIEELYLRYVIPLHGYASLDEYYQKWSSVQFLENVKTPLLIVNAKNDPFLSKNCFPFELCTNSEFVYLEAPKYGGHTGFTRKRDGDLWYLRRIEEFIHSQS